MDINENNMQTQDPAETAETSRVFTQEEVNQIVADRLARERRKAQQSGSTPQENEGGDSEVKRVFTQEEVNQIVADRLARQKRVLTSDLEIARQEGRAEAEKNAQEAASALQEKLAAREAEIAHRELQMQATQILAARGLPSELEGFLDFSDAEACNVSIDRIEGMFRAAVQKGIEDRLRASHVSLPAPNNGPDYDSMDDESFYRATMGRKGNY